MGIGGADSSEDKKVKLQKLKIILRNMQVTLRKIARFENDKNGNPLRTKDGKPYQSVRVQTEEHGDKWLSGFGNKTTDTWVEGSKVEVLVEQKGEYLNFKMPTANNVANIALQDLTARVVKLEEILLKNEHSAPLGDVAGVDEAFDGF